MNKCKTRSAKSACVISLKFYYIREYQSPFIYFAYANELRGNRSLKKVSEKNYSSSETKTDVFVWIHTECFFPVYFRTFIFIWRKYKKERTRIEHYILLSFWSPIYHSRIFSRNARTKSFHRREWENISDSLRNSFQNTFEDIKH